MDAEHIARVLLDWAAGNSRAYPWRTMDEVYPIAMAEVLLQKTRADDVLPVWKRLLEMCPTPDDLLDEPRSSVLAMVAELGLGTQRTERLRSAARTLSEGGAVASARGIGPYAKGVLALSMGERPQQAPIDGNLARIVVRFHALKFARGEARKKNEVRAVVDQWIDAVRDPADQLALVYACVDLGYAVCTPTKPLCGTCPLRDGCASSSAIPS